MYDDISIVLDTKSTVCWYDLKAQLSIHSTHFIHSVFLLPVVIDIDSWLFLDNSIHKDTLNMVLVWFTEMTNKNILIPYLRLSRKSDHSETPYKILRSH